MTWPSGNKISTKICQLLSIAVLYEITILTKSVGPSIFFGKTVGPSIVSPIQTLIQSYPILYEEPNKVTLHASGTCNCKRVPIS